MLYRWVRGIKNMVKKSYEIEKNTELNALAKEYIKLVVSEHIEKMQEEFRVIFSELRIAISKNSNDQGYDKRMDDIVSKLEYLEKRYKEDDKFTLTKAKMINFMEEQGIK